jgi:hypothetical protein
MSKAFFVPMANKPTFLRTVGENLIAGRGLQCADSRHLSSNPVRKMDNLLRLIAILDGFFNIPAV